jgi:two-component system, OmpR family, heavy metal sensor histidine kinase CusS
MKLSDIDRSCSIKTKLVVFIAGLLCILLFIAAWFVERRINIGFSLHQNETIENKLAMLHTIINNRPDYAEVIRKNLEWEAAYGAYPQQFTRILNGSGLTLVESTGMGSNIPSRLFSPPALQGTNGEDRVIQAPNNRYFLLKSDACRTPLPDENAIIQIALDVTPEVTIDAANHKMITLVLLVGIIASVTIVNLIVRQLLRPLEVIADFSTQITVTTIDKRIDSHNWPEELKRFAAILNAMLDRLEQSFIRLTEYTSNLAHELRTPLTTIIGEAEVALFKVRTPEEYQEVLESGREECLRVSRIIDNVLFMARAEYGTILIEQTLFDPIGEIRGIFRFYEALAEEQCATLSYHGTGTLVGDPLLFSRAVSNLLANSLTYSSPGVEIDLSVIQVEGQFVEVAIRDTGHGIAEKELDRVFDHFHRGDLSRSNYPLGSGLGLSIVKSIMDLHGGDISVTSQPGKGTCVTLRFPCIKTDERQNHIRKDV